MRSPAILTLDLGNSGGSAALIAPGESPDESHGDSPGAGATALARWTFTSPDDERSRLDASVLAARSLAPDRVPFAAISAVGSPQREERACEAFERHGFSVVRNPDAGLDMRIRHPETCGVDRQYAMRAVLHALGNSETRALVVDAGTALTVDAGDGSGEGAGAFLGGAIALGPGSLRDALVRAGARLPDFEVDPDAHALGRSSVEALRSGVVVGFRGTVAELTASIATEAFPEGARPRVFLTGGAGAFARAALERAVQQGQVEGPVFEDPLLVHRGLALAAANASKPTR